LAFCCSQTSTWSLEKVNKLKLCWFGFRSWWISLSILFCCLWFIVYSLFLRLMLSNS
jgi:hypothetical protein